MIEVTIKISNEEKKMSKRHVIYPSDDAPILLTREDPAIKLLVQEAVKEFSSEVDSVKVVILMIWE